MYFPWRPYANIRIKQAQSLAIQTNFNTTASVCREQQDVGSPGKPRRECPAVALAG